MISFLLLFLLLPTHITYNHRKILVDHKTIAKIFVTIIVMFYVIISHDRQMKKLLPYIFFPCGTFFFHRIWWICRYMYIICTLSYLVIPIFIAFLFIIGLYKGIVVWTDTVVWIIIGMNWYWYEMILIWTVLVWTDIGMN